MTPSRVRQTHTVSALEIPDEFYDWLRAKLKELGPEYERDYMMDDGGINLRDVAMVRNRKKD